MPRRYHLHASGEPPLASLFASALRAAFARGYSRADFRADLLAGLTVGIVALPLSMALAIASGVPPQHGLYTAIVAGAAIALLGGSSVSVSGPTAAFVVVLAPIAHAHGLGGLLLATMLAGALLIAMGFARLGRLIQFIPYPVTTGFTSGIALVIATLQVKDFFGLSVPRWPEAYAERVLELARAMPTAHAPDLALGLGTLAVLLLWPKLKLPIPAPLAATAAGALAAFALSRAAPGMKIATIGSRFSYEWGGQTLAGIPSLPPSFRLPWNFPGPDGAPLGLSFGLLRELLGPALAIAMLGAIESLLCAVVADGMAGAKHDPDGELIGQGLGNVLAPFFGGIAATAAIARTATSIRAGARTPVASLVHAGFVLAAMVALAPALAWLPMASMAALLLVVAWNMSELKHFAHILRVAPGSDVAVLVVCFLLTVFFDMVVAVSVGVVLAALLFMRRMAEISGAQALGNSHPRVPVALPESVLLYEIAGPLFFGAAEKAVGAIQSSSLSKRIVILDMTAVPAMDVTGLVALETMLAKLRRANTRVFLAGVRPQPAEILGKSRIKREPGWLEILPTFEDAVERVILIAPALETMSGETPAA